MLDSAVLEHGQVCRGCRFATSCSGQICSATKTCSWNPVQIGVARQPLASEFWGGLTSALGCFQPEGLECWTLACCSQQVGNLQHGQAASLKCWICLTVQGWSLVKLAGVADLQHFALVGCFAIKTLCRFSMGRLAGVARSVLPSRPAVGAYWCSWAAFGQ